MSAVSINSDFASLEENIFFITQAQRFLVRAILLTDISKVPWLADYVEDLDLDSWNNEFKCFYLRRDEGYFDADRAARAALLAEIFEIAAVELKVISYDAFLKSLLECNVFDLRAHRIAEGEIVQHFLPDFEPSNTAAVLGRISNVIWRLVGMLQDYKCS